MLDELKNEEMAPWTLILEAFMIESILCIIAISIQHLYAVDICPCVILPNR